jgi:DNA-binding MarR family transcriptional regulator
MIDDSRLENWPARLLRQPSWLLGRAARRGRHLAREELRSSELGLLDYLVLATLAERGTRSQAELVRVLPIDASDMVAVLRHLEQLELVRRKPDPENARRKLVELTPLGRRRQPRFDALVDRANERLLAPLTAAEAATLRRLLAKLLGMKR